MLPPRPPSHASTSSGSGSGGASIVHPDDAVRGTDDDAAASRLSAVSLGYLQDPFCSILYKPSRTATATASASGSGSGNGRKPPLINIGTHHRTYGIDLIVEQFFQKGGKQVVSLGAGSDTRFWRLMSRTNPAPPNIKKYIEIDFPHLTALKAQRIARSVKLNSLLSPQPISTSPSSSSQTQTYSISKGGTELVSELYVLIPLDLRPPPSSSSSSTSASTSTKEKERETGEEIGSLNLMKSLEEHLDPSLPTLFIAECVFCYLSPRHSQSIIASFSENFTNCMGVIYEMVGLNDNFGKVMKRNLATRNLSIPGSVFHTPIEHAQRFISAGFTNSNARTLWDIRKDVIDPEELTRLSKLEFLDEIEELRLVLNHYVIAWGTKGSIGGIGL